MEVARRKIAFKQHGSLLELGNKSPNCHIVFVRSIREGNVHLYVQALRNLLK